MMFQKNEYVMYETSGVCQISDIACPDFAKATERQYYFLKPLHSPCDCIYVPVGNETKLRIRKILTRDEANKLISKIPELEAKWIDDDNVREEAYKSALQSFDCYEWVKMIKSLYLKIDERKQDGKKPIQMDQKYMGMAEDYLHGELSVALDIPIEKVREHISIRVHEVETEE
ncbi:MAG: CarD family transcriptional regulator [Christensenellaceae bacterium]|jgi:CarD family transcriptional regulator